jgi:hypothetical protein
MGYQCIRVCTYTWAISVLGCIHMWAISITGSVHEKRLGKEGTSWHLVQVSEYGYVPVMILSVIW